MTESPSARATGVELDWAEIRKRFPAVERCTYLNTAGGGPMCREAADEVHRYADEMQQFGDMKWDEWNDRVEGVRQHLASILGALPQELAFMSNSSSGLNLVAEMMGREGEVLTMADDFPSVTLPWLLRDYPVRFLPSHSDGAASLEELARAVGKETRYVVVSYVQFATGFRHDLSALKTLCRERGLRLLLDATQGFGAFPVDVQGIDALVFSGYKWMTAGYGVAPLYVNASILKSRSLPAAGWRSAREPYRLVNDRLDLTQEARGLELGHMPLAGVFALGGALRMLDGIGLDRIASRIHRLTDRLHESMIELSIPILSPRERANRSGITVLDVGEPAPVAEELKKRNIFVAARRNGLRVALHFYNDEEDINRFAMALSDIVRR